jgi:hypothetical protein
MFKNKESKHLAVFMFVYCVFAIFGFVNELLHTFVGLLIYQIFLVCLVITSYIVWEKKKK